MFFRNDNQLAAAELNVELKTKLDKDLKLAAETLTEQQVRHLVDTYYTYQNNRIRAAHQLRALNLNSEPHDVIDWISVQSRALEASIKGALEIYAKKKELGQWAMSVCGVGPVITAGLLSHIDFDKAPTAGHIFSFAGVLPESHKPKKGEKRAYNANLKTLVFKAGDCFVKFQNNKKDFYGSFYKTRKTLEWSKNLAGDFADQARKALEGKDYGKDTLAYLWYSGSLPDLNVNDLLNLSEEDYAKELKKRKGKPGDFFPKLPPAHIHMRALRWTAKLFLSHFHAVGYWLKFAACPPAPYAIAHLNHVHLVLPPNLDQFAGGENLAEQLRQKAREANITASSSLSKSTIQVIEGD